MVCLQCRAMVDSCWRWCPDCGSSLLIPPAAAGGAIWQDDYSVEWKIDGDGFGRSDDQPQVASPA
jgi:hypothetical protein